MDLKIWEESIISWVNCLSSSSPISCINQINNLMLMEIIKKINPDIEIDPVQYLKEIYPNLSEHNSFILSSSFDYLCAATLLLLHVTFSQGSNMVELHEIMCKKLENSTQIVVAEFLANIQELPDVFKLSFNNVKQEILKFVEKKLPETSCIGDCLKTPMKPQTPVSNSNSGSPLLGFFETPKRNSHSRHPSSNFCNNDHHLKLIMKLKAHIEEEEQEKLSLQEKLNIQSQKIIEYEAKIKSKIDEINHLKSEWESDAKKNEAACNHLNNTLMKKLDDEKILKKELSTLETYVIKLESDLTTLNKGKEKLETQLKESVERNSQLDLEIKDLSDLNKRLQTAVEDSEKELKYFREEYVNFHKDEKSIDVSFMNGSVDKNISMPESMEVVVEKMLSEKKEENALLRETVEELKKEKNNLMQEMKELTEKLSHKCSTISELQFLNKELIAKIEQFELTEKELHTTQIALENASKEISKLVIENNHLSENFTVLKKSLEEREQTLKNCSNSKVILENNFFKLAEEFKTVQQRLECEVKNISKLAVDTLDKIPFDNSSTSNKNITTDNIIKSKDVFNRNFEQISDLYKNYESNEHFINDTSAIVNDRLQKVTELMQYLESYHTEWFKTKNSLQSTCHQLNENIILLKMKINELEENQKISFKEKAEIEIKLKEPEIKFEAYNSTEIQKLKKELKSKENKIGELENIIKNSRKYQEDLLFENENLKKELSRLTKQYESQILNEGGDFNKTRTITFAPDHKAEKLLEPTRDHQEFNDSLEVQTCNKTFDIVNLEDKNINETTFSIKRGYEHLGKNSKNSSVWVVSPPSKSTNKPSTKDETRERRRVRGESWVVPVAPSKLTDSKIKKISSSVNNLSEKSLKIENKVNVAKSSSLSSIIEIEYSPPSKVDSKSSATSSYLSVHETVGSRRTDGETSHSQNIRVKEFAERIKSCEVSAQKVKSLEHSDFRLVDKRKDPLGDVFKKKVLGDASLKIIDEKEKELFEIRKRIIDATKENEQLRTALIETEQERKKEKELFEKNLELSRQNIANKYEGQLEHLKNEMKLLYNRELEKHKNDLREHDKRHKEHIDELNCKMWDLREKLLQEQNCKRDMERMYIELKKKYEAAFFHSESDTKNFTGLDVYFKKEPEENSPLSSIPHLPAGTFPIIPTEDEEEVFDNRFLQDMKTGSFKEEKPEGRLLELQYRNSLCLPHLKSSYPGETQFHNPTLFKENELKLGQLPFILESQSLTDSDHSMTRSLLPENKGKKKEQTSYKRPGPPTPSKNGGRLSIQSGDLGITPRNPLKDLNDQSDKSKTTPNPLKGLLAKSGKTGSLGSKDENTAPLTPRRKRKFFRKPFGARDH